MVFVENELVTFMYRVVDRWPTLQASSFPGALLLGSRARAERLLVELLLCRDEWRSRFGKDVDHGLRPVDVLKQAVLLDFLVLEAIVLIQNEDFAEQVS